ncbi:hypothetical protein B0I37DRAFT_219690 [Chaetomium sp. MPI-CAGE-AT-0009]|nr:hypothetical protein B0I37DRAFT_219690 [Chaetomium sp. MPI-CAGE-AT-0009]
MDQTEAGIEENPTPCSFALFNDVHFGRRASQSQAPGNSTDTENITTGTIPTITTWASFPRLPAELRLNVWLSYLRRYRLIEVDVCAADHEDETTYPGNGGDNASQPRYYTGRNHLGKIVSGRGYTLSIRGRGCYAASLSPLLWVNSEARLATLSFYQIHLPFPGLHKEQVLYLNPAYDVVYVRPRQPEVIRADRGPNASTLLADFLHDAKAYDYKDQGVVHLALHRHTLLDSDDEARLTPAVLHPAAATSFADILRRSLRSVLCITNFRSRLRGMGEFPTSKWHYHFAHTFPLFRRGHGAGSFHWFDTDPRPGVEIDLRQLPLQDDPRPLPQAWEQLEQAFGITEEQRAARDSHGGGGGFRFYICPTVSWPAQFETPTPVEEGSREELAGHLRFEIYAWLRERRYISLTTPGYMIPKHGTMIDAETFERMEKAPSLAIGMWLFPPEAFKRPTILRRSCFNVSAVRPGLFLFEV